MTQSKPLVSLIITSYNREKLIGKAIESSLEQTYPNLEIIISDNCSTDGTEQVIARYTKDPRVRYFRNSKNLGMVGNFRKATYEYAMGEYITFVNSDDYLLDKNYITDAVELALSDPEIHIVWARMGVKNLESGFLWELPEKPFFVKTVWDGKDVFFTSQTTVLLSWGACLMKKESMLKVKTFHGDYFNFDTESNNKMLLLVKAGFINRLSYIQVVHDNNAGFPADASKLIHSLECYENIASFALANMPEREGQVLLWKEHFIYSVISWAMHNLSVRNKIEYKKFRVMIAEKYPDMYTKFIQSQAFRRLKLVNAVKKFIPHRLVVSINKFRYFLRPKN